MNLFTIAITKAILENKKKNDDFDLVIDIIFPVVGFLAIVGAVIFLRQF